MSRSEANLAGALCAIVLAGVACGAWAAEGYFLKDVPVSKMTKDDFAIANAVIRQALDEGADGRAYAWENAATGASGSITPQAAFSRNGTTCRRARFDVSAGGLRNVSTWTLCKSPDGWKAVDD